MQLGRGTRIAMRIASFTILAFIYIPIGIIVLYSFNESRVATWPISGLTLDWYRQAFADPGIRNALSASVEAAIGATIVALALGTLIALAVQRYKFFGRETISFLVILPIALPGIVTGIALSTAFRAVGIELGMFTIIVGHATFCIVTIYNNVIARLRRTSATFEEASGDLVPTRSGRSGGSRCRPSGPRSSRVRCSRSPCRSTRSSSPTSRQARTSRRCRSGSSATTPGRTSCRS